MSSKQPTPREGGSGSIAWVIAVVVLLVAAVGAIAVVARGGGDDSSTNTAATSPAGADGVTGPTVGDGAPAPAGAPVVVAPVKINGTPLPEVGDGGADKAVGLPFPAMTGQSVFDGSEVAIALDGRPKVVLFIAHWCPHCQKEVPLIQKWLEQQGKPADVDLYAVSTGVSPDRGNYPPATWLKKVRWSVPTLADSANNDAFTMAGLTGYPSFIVIGADGKVLTRTSGELSIEAFSGLVDQAAGR